MSNGSLLLVDDDRQVLEAMADWLREQGFSLDTADSYAGAMAALTAKPYDLVLADVRLSDVSGYFSVQ